MKQEIFHLSPQLSGVLRCALCLTGLERVWGQKGLTSARLLNLSRTQGSPRHHVGMPEGFSPGWARCRTWLRQCSSVPQFPPAVEQRWKSHNARGDGSQTKTRRKRRDLALCYTAFCSRLPTDPSHPSMGRADCKRADTGKLPLAINWCPRKCAGFQ